MNALTTQPNFAMGEIMQMAKAIADGGLFGSKDPAAVLTLCLMAQADGQHPARAMLDYDIIQGKPAKKAEAMLRDLIRSGGTVKWHDLDDTIADATFSHPQGGEVRIAWDMARAQKAGLGNKPMWKQYPRQMLRSRVVSEGVRTVAPGATGGVYTPEEQADIEPPAMRNVTPEPPPAPRRGKASAVAAQMESNRDLEWAYFEEATTETLNATADADELKDAWSYVAARIKAAPEDVRERLTAVKDARKAELAELAEVVS